MVNPQWLLTHRSCAQEAMPQDGVPEKFAVARLGAYLDNPTLNFLSGHEQVMATFNCIRLIYRTRAIITRGLYTFSAL